MKKFMTIPDLAYLQFVQPIADAPDALELKFLL